MSEIYVKYVYGIILYECIVFILCFVHWFPYFTTVYD